jgi:glutathione synthase/RimK-type ligase-like ATP-grasp enzyme
VKETILDVARSIPEMEYFGFDVAVTEDGIKFPEINRFPDYPRIEKLSPETMHYLLKKLDEKKRRCGYDKKPCRKLVHLPKR